MILLRPALLAWALIWSVSALCAQATGAAQIRDDQNAFHGYVMQSPLSQYPSLKVLKIRSAEFVKEVGEYENPGEVLAVNDVTFLRVRYRFADRRLESIQLVYEGRDNRERLVQWLEAQYGKLTSSERKMVNQVEWQGHAMTITLSYNFTYKRGTLWFVSPELNHLLHNSIASLPD
jgi:hypothetical protein